MLQRIGIALSLLICPHIHAPMAVAWESSPVGVCIGTGPESAVELRTMQMEIQPAELDFGPMAAGQSALASVSLVNRDSLRSVGCLRVTGGPFTLRSRNGADVRELPYDLAPGGTLLFDLRYTAPDGPVAEDLLVLRSGQTLASARLLGSGGIPRCSIDPPQIDFGAVVVGESAVKQLRIGNAGTGILLVSPRVHCRDDGFDLKGGFQLLPLELGTCRGETVAVCFRPRSVGRQECVIRFNDLGCASVCCRGVGVATDSTCFIVPSYMDFGSIQVGGARTMSFTILNLGNVVIRGAVRAQSECYKLAEGGGIYSLMPGQTHRVEVVFKPSELAGHDCIIQTGNSICGPVSCYGIGLDGAAWSADILMAEPCARLDGGEVVLSWKCPTDSTDAFHVYRRRGSGSPRRITSEPVIGLAGTALFRDPALGVPVGSVVHYSCGLVRQDREVARSPETAVTLSESTPACTALRSNYPNPFNGKTTIEFELAEAGQVKLVVCDLNGRRIRSLIDGELPAASHVCQWDGRDTVGQNVASGVYRYFLETGELTAVGRMLLLR